MIYALATLIAVLQFADYWLTMKVLARGGTELNPVMRFLFKGFGTKTGLLIGKFYVVLFVIIGAIMGWFDSNEGLLAMAIMFVVYAVVVLNNLWHYGKSVKYF